MTRLLLFCLLSTSALAQTETVVQLPDRTIVRPKTVIRFNDVEIEPGQRARPSDSYVPVRPRGIFPSLMTVRGSFAPELQKSVDQL